MVRSAVVCLLCALLLALWIAPGSAEAQEIRSQIAVYTTTVTWIAAPYTAVVAELHGPDGIKADGAQVADNARKARVRLTSPDRAEDAVIRPGDVIVVRAGGTAAVTVTVPTLAMELDVPANRLVGIAPPADHLELEVTAGDEVVSDLRFRPDQGPGGQHRAQQGPRRPVRSSR